MPQPSFQVLPVTAERWADLERLFGPQGASYGCWCMWFRRRSGEMSKSKAKDNKAAIRSLVEAGDEPGLIAYVDGDPAGWISLAPREDFPRLVYSRTFRPIDERPVWSVVCFVIGKSYRRRGLSGRLLAAAVEYARGHGARTLEAYPVEPAGDLTGDRGYQGIRSTFAAAGFSEVTRAANGRPVMRLELGP
jgi:GNAT superfamily N-acetyltransferase